jgi:hypothetical protein
MSENSGPYYQLVNNFQFPKHFTPENIEFILNYKPENGEKFIAVYPKCGSTWTQHIICLILNNGIFQKSDSELLVNSFFDRFAKESLKISMKPRVLKTHLPFDLIPYNKSAQYLCILRNPKDTIVSMYYFYRDLWPEVYADIAYDFHKYFDCWIKGELPFGDYFRHVLSYWPHRFDDNFTFLVYEHMKKNPKDAVLKIAQFLGEEFVIKLKENNDLILNKVLENSTIDATKSVVTFDTLVRKGVVGDWKNHFNKAESDLVDEKVRQLWTGTGLENLWAEDMKW